MTAPRTFVAALLCAAVLVGGCAAPADTSRHPVDLLNCVRPSNNVNTVFGPTDISATTGNGGLSVGVNDRGTVTRCGGRVRRSTTT
ncbi:MAG: hypothetical protein R2716_05000 [Microthrixaceae bacterium]